MERSHVAAVAKASFPPIEHQDHSALYGIRKTSAAAQVEVLNSELNPQPNMTYVKWPCDQLIHSADR